MPNHAAANQIDLPQFSLRNLLLIVTITALFFGAVGYIGDRQLRKQVEHERLAKLDKAAAEQIVKDIEAIRTKLGRAPEDTKELESLLGHSMPVIHAYGSEYAIRYSRLPDGNFTLDYLSESFNITTYDSRKPSAGWVEVPF